MNTFKWVLSNHLKYFQQNQKTNGFTLIELLVAMIIAFLVITPLLGLMISILTTDRQEQAKATSEQEVQAAMDYITRDLQQAIYIYDDEGVDAIKDELPTITDGKPVLVFWKREFVKDVDKTKFTPTGGSEIQFNDDSFVNALVAYYLIHNNAEPWSKAARIARFQIKDGVPNRNGNTCPQAYDTTIKYTLCPDPGFQPVDLFQTDKTLIEKMNSWEKADQDYTQNTIVLVDFIDHTTTAKAPLATCPTSDFKVVPSETTRTGFYACVNSISSEKRSVAEVHIRGNALARFSNDTNNILYNPNQTSYFPTGRVRVEGRSFIFSK
ncbi:MAG: hormogonium polysaccharide secretion pseudopilin HpsC [Nostoc sp. LLA-1]|nr:hormogonium polysaccharide secretion pseudopilin HpsC [Cyanocohniella sp. LLY]